MYRATTPRHTYKLPIQASTCKVIQVTYTQGNTEIVKQSDGATLPDGMTYDENKVIIRLTQEETLRFKAKAPAFVQVRALTYDGDALASRSFKIDVYEVQNKEILT